MQAKNQRAAAPGADSLSRWDPAKLWNPVIASSGSLSTKNIKTTGRVGKVYKFFYLVRHQGGKLVCPVIALKLTIVTFVGSYYMPAYVPLALYVVLYNPQSSLSSNVNMPFTEETEAEKQRLPDLVSESHKS